MKLIEAIKQNDRKTFFRLLTCISGVLDEKDEKGNGPLYWAAFYGHLDFVRALLEAGARVNQLNDDGFSALYTAAYRGHTEIVVSLLQAKADPSCGKNGFTAVHAAAHAGQKQVVSTFAIWGIKMDAQNEQGITPLHCAAYQGHLDATILLLYWDHQYLADCDKLTPLDAAYEGKKIAEEQSNIEKLKDYDVIIAKLKPIPVGEISHFTITCVKRPATLVQFESKRAEDKSICSRVFCAKRFKKN